MSEVDGWVDERWEGRPAWEFSVRIVEGKGYTEDLFSPIIPADKVKYLSGEVNTDLVGWMFEPVTLSVCAR